MTIYYTIQTYIVYIFTAIVLYFCCRESVRTKNYGYIILGIVVYAIIFGIRYGVGVDCIQYIRIYENAQKGIFNDRIELGYDLLMNFFVTLQMPCWCFMAFVAFAQLFLIFRAFKDKVEIAPFIALTFVFGCTWLVYSNGMRQTIAFCLFVLALYYGEKRNWIVHYGLIILAMQFHKSAMLLLIIYPLMLINNKRIPPIKLQYIVFIIAFIIGRINVIQQVFFIFENFSDSFGYNNYIERYNEEKWNMSLNFGVGYYINLLLPLVIFKYSDIFRNKGRLTIIYNMYFAGALLKYAFLTTHVIQRVNYYFYGFDFIVGAIVMYHLYKQKKFTPLYLLFAIYALLFVGQLSKMFTNASAYYTIFQIDDYHRMHVQMIK